MGAAITNEQELYLAPGGATYRFIQRKLAGRRGKTTIPQRIAGLLAVTWVPMCVFAVMQGCALGATARGSFLLDFPTYARFFVGIPILVIAEELIGPRLRAAGLRFVDDELVRPEDIPAFERAIERLAKRRDSVVAAMSTILLAMFGAWWLTLDSAMGVGTDGWRALTLIQNGVVHYSLAALWNRMIAGPIVLFLVYRWLWRILIWTLFLLDVARMNLRLVPTHADRAAGLGFLPLAHLTFGALSFALGCVLSAEAAFRMFYEGAGIQTFKLPLIILLVFTQVVFLGPLLVFTPNLARAKRLGLLTYGSLVIEYNRAFHEKWVAPGTGRADEPFLGTSDIQSLADLGNSFRFIDEMRMTVFDRLSVLRLAIITALPGLPLLLLIVPFSEIVAALAKVVF